jgi:hypothetical protein
MPGTVPERFFPYTQLQTALNRTTRHWYRTNHGERGEHGERR